MITSVELQNVRLFDGEGWNFPISPISVFCGTNSSGKSTLLKALLLLRQSIVLRDTSESLKGKLVFTSSHVDLGSYHSLVTKRERHRDIVLGITIQDIVPTSFINSLRASKGIETREPSKERRPTTQSYTLKCSFTFGLKKKGSSGISTARTAAGKAASENGLDSNEIYTNQGFLKNASFEMSHENEVLLSFQVVSSIAGIGAENNTERYELILPRFYIDSFTKSLGIGLIGIETLDTKETSDVRKFEATLLGVLPQGLRAKWISHKTSKETSKTRASTRSEPLSDLPLPPHIGQLIEDLRKTLSHIHYLGPFRTPAKRYYIAHEDASPDLDSTGEFLPFILQKRSDARLPGNISSKSDSSIRTTLSQALNFWVHYLRTGERGNTSDVFEEIAPKTSNEVLVELMLKTPTGNNSYALTDSGFGYSQILPILVRGLLAEPGSTLIVEQPELHLNPALQVRLAEFFVEMMRSGKQVLLETHSEHLVNAIRILVAEDETSEIASKAGIIFMDAEAGRPTVRRLDVLPDGTIPDWPQAFFGEAISLSARLLRAQGRFRTSKPRPA